MNKNNISYFQFSLNLISDQQYLAMPYQQRALYLMLIIELFRNDGKIILNDQLHSVFNCKDKKYFYKILEKIKHKFKIKNNILSSSFVTAELRKIKKKMQTLKNKALTAAQKRWHSDATSMSQAMPQAYHADATSIQQACPPLNNNENETKRNENEKDKDKNENINENENENRALQEHATGINQKIQDDTKPQETQNQPTEANSPSPSDSVLNSFSPSPSSISPSPTSAVTTKQTGRRNVQPEPPEQIEQKLLEFLARLNEKIPARTKSDRTCYQNVTRWLHEGCLEGKFNTEFFEMVLDLADKCRDGVNPAALFMSLLQKQLGFRTGKKHDPADLPQQVYEPAARRYNREYIIDDPNIMLI